MLDKRLLKPERKEGSVVSCLKRVGITVGVQASALLLWGALLCVTFYLRASGSRTENGNDDSVKLASFVWGLHICHVLRRGPGPQSVVNKYQQSLRQEQRLYVLCICWKAKGNGERKILEIFVQYLEMWDIQSIFFAMFSFKQLQFLSTIIFLSCYAIRFSFWWHKLQIRSWSNRVGMGIWVLFSASAPPCGTACCFSLLIRLHGNHRIKFIANVISF